MLINVSSDFARTCKVTEILYIEVLETIERNKIAE